MVGWPPGIAPSETFCLDQRRCLCCQYPCRQEARCQGDREINAFSKIAKSRGVVLLNDVMSTYLIPIYQPVIQTMQKLYFNLEGFSDNYLDNYR
ncbi:hypothetical protein SAMN06296020_1403, partial [Anoxynatronum buryatiense]